MLQGWLLRGPRQADLTQLGIGGSESREASRGKSGQWLKARVIESMVLLEGWPYGLVVGKIKGSQEAEEVCRSWSQEDLANQGQECGFRLESLSVFSFGGPWSELCFREFLLAVG